MTRFYNFTKKQDFYFCNQRRPQFRGIRYDHVKGRNRMRGSETGRGRARGPNLKIFAGAGAKIILLNYCFTKRTIKI